jgi:hypothetical protein
MYYANTGLGFTFVFAIMTFIGYFNNIFPLWYLSLIILMMITLSAVDSVKYKLGKGFRI